MASSVDKSPDGTEVNLPDMPAIDGLSYRHLHGEQDAEAVHALRGRGMDIIRLSTVAEFRRRALDLYTSAGFRVVKEFPRYRKPPEQE